MTKAELRKKNLAERSALTEAVYLQYSRQIADNFFMGIDVAFIKVLHIFIPIEQKREPNTWLIIDRIRREYPHIRLVLPRVNSDTGLLENFFYEGIHQLQKNNWNILEPKQGVPAEIEKIDMVLIPLLAFDLQGQRVGYGKGFYDKFLVHCKPECKRIGLSLTEAVEQIDDLNPFDIPLHGCVTPTQVYSF